MTAPNAAEDRFNRVTYLVLPIPPECQVRGMRRRSKDAIGPVRRRRVRGGSRFQCLICGEAFRCAAARSKKVGAKRYARRFCSRACYGKWRTGRTFESTKKEKTT